MCKNASGRVDRLKTSALSQYGEGVLDDSAKVFFCNCAQQHLAFLRELEEQLAKDNHRMGGLLCFGSHVGCGGLLFLSFPPFVSVFFVNIFVLRCSPRARVKWFHFPSFL